MWRHDQVFRKGEKREMIQIEIKVSGGFLATNIKIRFYRKEERSINCHGYRG